MTIKALSAPKVLTEEGFQDEHAVLIQNGKIEDIIPVTEVTEVTPHERFETGLLVPGFIDTQVNGGGGLLLNDAPNATTVKTMIEAHSRYGTTGMLPTLITDDIDKISAAIEAIDVAVTEGTSGILGIHLEGPFLNREKKGIHDGDKIRVLGPEHLPLLTSLKHGKTLVTLAPEKAPSTLVKQLVDAGCIVAAGHTNATYEEMQEGLREGITGFTHLFNAMSPFESRSPGVVGAALTSKDSFAGLIPDGHHVHPASLQAAIRTIGTDHSVIVTDSMCTVGSEQTHFDLNGERITLKDGRLTNEAGVLAGSALDMASAVRFMVNEVGIDLVSALKMASSTPAAFLGLSDTMGRIKPGLAANILLLDDTLTVQQTLIDGKTVFKSFN